MKEAELVNSFGIVVTIRGFIEVAGRRGMAAANRSHSAGSPCACITMINVAPGSRGTEVTMTPPHGAVARPVVVGDVPEYIR